MRFNAPGSALTGNGEGLFWTCVSIRFSRTGRLWVVLKTWAGNTNYLLGYANQPKSVRPVAKVLGFPTKTTPR